MSNIISYAAWSFLPNFITTNLQTLYYNLTIRAGSPQPQPGTPLHTSHRRVIHALVITTYLLYTLYEADWEICAAGDFYTDLGVSRFVDEKTLQTRFRKLTLLYHPDKIGEGNAMRKEEAEKYYVHLKLARDTLLDPVKRFAYDRFGPQMLEWRQCTSVGDYVLRGIKALVPFYGGSFVFMFGAGYAGFFEFGKYWRYVAFAILGLFELHAITRPYFPLITLTPTLLNPLATLPLPSTLALTLRPTYLPFQAIKVAHKAIITLLIAINQLSPLIPRFGVSVPSSVDQAILRLEQMLSVYAVEAPRLLALEGAPLKVVEANGDVVVGGSGLQEKVKEWFVTNAVRNDAGVRAAVERVVERRREEGRAMQGGRGARHLNGVRAER